MASSNQEPVTDRWGGRRRELLDAAADWTLEHGVAALTLRPLAAALGTSDRMLVYHFGGKDQLVDEIIAAVNDRLLSALAPVVARIASDSPKPKPSSAVVAAWQQLSAPATAPYVRFLAEVSALGVRQPQRFAGPARSVLESWLDVVAPLLAPEGGPDGVDGALATAVVAALYALAVDVALLGDRSAPDAAVAALAGLLDQPRRGPRA